MLQESLKKMYELLITKVNGVDSKNPSSTEFINKSLYEKKD